MLMLTRRAGESIDLTDTVTGKVVATVTVLAFLPGGLVRLGFVAPATISILRDNAKERVYGGRKEDEAGDEGEANGNRA
jgi:carbon storage regulator CsrA